jgi:hypothetical protein
MADVIAGITPRRSSTGTPAGWDWRKREVWYARWRRMVYVDVRERTVNSTRPHQHVAHPGEWAPCKLRHLVIRVRRLLELERGFV